MVLQLMLLRVSSDIYAAIHMLSLCTTGINSRRIKFIISSNSVGYTSCLIMTVRNYFTRLRDFLSATMFTR